MLVTIYRTRLTARRQRLHLASMAEVNWDWVLPPIWSCLSQRITRHLSPHCHPIQVKVLEEIILRVWEIIVIDTDIESLLKAQLLWPCNLCFKLSKLVLVAR